MRHFVAAPRGISAPDRYQDFADVLNLIRANSLPEDFAAQLHAKVRDQYREVWSNAQRPAGEF